MVQRQNWTGLGFCTVISYALIFLTTGCLAQNTMNNKNSHEISHFISTGAGVIGGSPTRLLSRDESSITVFSTFNSIIVPKPIPVQRIGLFRIETSPELKAMFEQLEDAFIRHHDDIPNPGGTIPGSTFMRYSIQRPPFSVSGEYFYHLGLDALEDDLKLIGKISLHVLEKGQPIEAIEPVISVQQTPAGFLTRLDINNIGIRPTAIEGPNHWDERYDIPITFPAVVYILREGKTIVKFSLTTQHLMPTSQQFAERIDIPAQSKASIEFLIPYSAVTDTKEPALPLPTGDYNVLGSLRTRFARPSQLGGSIIDSPTTYQTKLNF